MTAIVRSVGLLVVAARLCVAQQGSQPRQLIDSVVREVCAKRVVLLGESPTHGFGRVLELKVEIVRRLVNECSFNGLFIESGAYDFLEIQKELKNGRTVAQPAIAAAIGGLLAYREVEPLLPLLSEKIRQGALVLGGLDDQLGRGTYAQQRMPADLVTRLAGDDNARCLAIFQRHTQWQYTNEAPYSREDNARIVGCLDEIALKLATPRDSAAGEYDRAMIENLKRMLARDFRQSPPSGADLEVQNFNDRDRSMATNFQWFMSRLPARSKVIVWTATVHAAKSLSGVPGRERWMPLGSYIRRQFDRDAFALGFSAYSGSYAMGRQPPRQLPSAPATALESRAFDANASDVRYFNWSQLRELGPVPARVLGADFKTANWSDVLDGLVVFREEHPPHP